MSKVRMFLLQREALLSYCRNENLFICEGEAHASIADSFPLFEKLRAQSSNHSCTQSHSSVLLLMSSFLSDFKLYSASLLMRVILLPPSFRTSRLFKPSNARSSSTLILFIDKSSRFKLVKCPKYPTPTSSMLLLLTSKWEICEAIDDRSSWLMWSTFSRHRTFK